MQIKEQPNVYNKTLKRVVDCPPPTPNCVIEKADFRVFMKNLPVNSVDLILTDPPYAISRKTGFSNLGKHSVERFAVSMDFGKWDANEIDIEELSTEMYRLLKSGGTAIIFYDLWKFNFLANAMIDAGFKQLRLITWEKTNPVPLNSKRNYLSNSREIAVLGVKHGKPTFHGEYHNGVYRYPIPNNGKRYHPTQKPLKLMLDLIYKHSDKNQTVLDPFLGSGTTAVAAITSERKFVGCDTDETYINIARKRIETLQIKQ